MTTRTWVSGTGDWITSPALWSTSTVPTAADSADITGGTATISAGESVAANAVTVDAGFYFLPAATLDIASGGTLNVATSLLLGNSVMDLAGAVVGTLTLPPFDQNAPVQPGSATVVAAGGTLTGAIIVPSLKTLTVSSTGDFNVVSAGAGSGQITINGGNLKFLGSPTIDNAIITSTGYLDIGPESALVSPGTTTTLNLGANVDLLENGGVIAGYGGTLDNKGLIDVQSVGADIGFDGDLILGLLGTFINEGTVDLKSGTTSGLGASGTLSNAASGLIEVAHDGTLSVVGAPLENAGTITIGAGAMLYDEAAETIVSSNLLANYGNFTNSGGTVILSGTLLNSGNTLSWSALTARLGTTMLTGTIVGGTIIADSPGVPSGGFTLDGVTWDGTITPTGTLTLMDGVTLHAENVTGQGVISVTAPGEELSLNGSLDSANIAIGNAATADFVSVFGTFGPGVTLTSSAPGGQITVNSVAVDPHIPVGPPLVFIQGIIDADSAGGNFTINNSFSLTGTIIAQNDDIVTITQGQTSTTGTYIVATGGTIAFDAGAGQPAFGGTITFADSSAARVMLTNPTPSPGEQFDPRTLTVEGFRPGNQIDLVPELFTEAAPLGDYAAQLADGTIDVTFNGLDYVDLVVGPGGPAITQSFSFSADGGTGASLTLACFVTGTRISRPDGDFPVEQICPGDLVRVAGGGVRSVQWVGYRDIAVSAHPMPEKVRPIWIRANARGPGVPRRDLLLSPDHAIFVDGVLIPAGLLVNGVSILPAHDVPRPRYWHVELDAHDILFAEGLPVESFLDTGQRNGFADGSGVVMLSPGFSLDRVAQIWETLAAAPLILRGPRLQAVRSQLAANIGVQGTTYDVAV